MARVLTKDSVVEVDEDELASLPESPLRVVDPEPRYTIREISDAQVEALRKKHTRIKWVQHQPVNEVDGVAFGSELIDSIIVSWAGIKDERGEPLPCTAETKGWLAEDVRLAILKRARMNRIVGKDHSFRTTA